MAGFFTTPPAPRRSTAGRRADELPASTTPRRSSTMPTARSWRGRVAGALALTVAALLLFGVCASGGASAAATGSAPARRVLLPLPADDATPFGPAPLPLDPARDTWTQLKDRHAGDECLFIGNGPSLNKLDWSFLNAAKFPVVMGVNKIYLGFKRFNIRVNYLACTNRRILTPEQSLDTFSRDLDPRVVKFFRADRWLADATFNAEHNVVPIRSISLCNASTCRTAVPAPGGGLDALGHRRMTYVNDTSVCAAAQCRECFCDPSKAYVEGNTVTYASLQILYFLGCARVYLVGVDHSFLQQAGAENSAQLMAGADPNHFDGSYFANQTWDLADLSSSEAHYLYAKRRFEDDGREIVDLTVDGKLRVFRRADYRDLFLPTGGEARNPPPAPAH